MTSDDLMHEIEHLRISLAASESRAAAAEGALGECRAVLGAIEWSGSKQTCPWCADTVHASHCRLDASIRSRSSAAGETQEKPCSRCIHLPKSKPCPLAAKCGKRTLWVERCCENCGWNHEDECEHQGDCHGWGAESGWVPIEQPAKGCGPCVECPADGICETQAEQPTPAPEQEGVRRVVEAARGIEGVVEHLKKSGGRPPDLLNSATVEELCKAVRALDGKVGG